MEVDRELIRPVVAALCVAERDIVPPDEPPPAVEVEEVLERDVLEDEDPVLLAVIP